MNDVTASLAPLFKQARAEGKWFWSAYQNLWFTPDELEREQAEGRFRWAAVNWRLRDPREYVAYCRRNVESAQAEFDRIYAKVMA